MKLISRIVSYLFHPLFVPTYGAFFIIVVNPDLFGHFGERLHGAWLITVFALTFLFPLVWLVMMKRLEMIQSLALETKSERIVPLIATATFYLWAAWMTKPGINMKIPSNELIFYMMLGCCASVFLAFFINIFSKVSLHTTGAGSFLGLSFIMTGISSSDLRFFLVGVIIIAGAVGAARLILEAHDKREVFTGYLVGFIGQFISFIVVRQLF